MQTYYEFGVDGATISTPGSPFSLRISSDNIEMLANGNTVSRWDNNSMYVTQFIGEIVTLGNHQIAKIIDGTVVKAL
jgi:hypothetical protein